MRRSVRLYGSRGIGFACIGLIIAAGVTLPAQQQIVPGANVNMVSGTKFPDGDPYLQRQNEPSSAVSTRNPLHILGSANDYRTVDIPHPLDTLRTHLNNADAWLGLFKSLDGGQNWTSTLLPGYPQDPNRAGPLFGYDAATDPVIRAGTSGMFYFAGLAFNRGENAASAVFVARFMDMNNLEAGDPIVHLDTGVVDSNTGAKFLDKTALATDIPRTAATCTFNVPLGDADNTIVPQTIPAGNVYLAYSAFTGTEETEQSVIMFTRSTDCGTTWSTPKALSTGSRLVQNAQIAVDPATGYVYVSWRRFHYLSQDDAVMVIRSTNGGTTFGKPVRVAGVQPFDQPTKDTSFRSNGFQTMTVDGSGRAYLAWTERGHATLRPSPIDGDARIVISTSTNGTTWTVPRAIAPDGLGHQLMPALTFHAGRLRLLYYDLREDVSQVFAPFVDEFNILQANSPVRHTMDVFVAQANPGVAPVFTTARLSDYAFGFAPDSDAPIRLQFNPPNLPLFKQGTAPFMGDYIDLAPAPAFVQNANGSWSYNTAPSTSATSHAFWTDNRDVRPPRDGDWTNYAPPRSAELGTQSRFDPTVAVPACTPDHDGMRNQNIYTARVTEGLFVSAPGNNKPLGDFQRAFVVVAENATASIRSFRLTIANQPVGGEASFLQFSPLPTLDVTVPPFSSVARTVFASSTDERARINVSIVEITTPGGGVVPGGLAGAVVLNPDPSLLTPRLQNPRLQNPRLQNPDITAAEAYNAGLTNAVFAVPRLQNPRLQNPSIENPRLQNDSLGNPRLQNDAVANPGVVSVGTTSADIENPRLQNPRLQNPRLQNQALDDANFIDTSWAITNDGNTTAAYTINLVLNEAIPAGFASQLLIHKTTTTPASIECNLAEQLHTVLIANIPDPEFVPFADIENPRLQNPRLQNPTIALAPGESATVTLRIVDPDRFDDVTYDASGAVTPAAVAQSVNTEDVIAGSTTPTVAVPMTITTTALPSAAPGAPYTRSLQTLASLGALTCTVVDGALPPGVGLNPNGTISGAPTTPGNYRFTIRCVDANGNADDQPLFIQIEPAIPAGFDAAWNGADTDWSNPDNWSPRGVPQAADRVYVPAAITVVPALTRNVTIRDLVVEPGARVDTNGFTLTVTHNADAGRTIVGTGTTILTGDGAIATGVFSNLEIRGRVTLNGPVTATGRLTLAAGARLNLNGQSLIAGGQLVTNVTSGAPPVITGPAGSFIVAGVLVNGLVLENAPLTIDGSGGTAALSQFDNVRFGAFAPEAVQLTVNHPGLTTHFAMAGASFTTMPSTGRLLQANDTDAGASALIVDIVRAVPADGTAATSTNGGAIVNWISDPGDANLAVTQSVSPIPAVAGTPLTYVITVTNGGPAIATSVTLNPGVPSGATGVTSSTTQGTCTAGSGGLACSLGTLSPGSQAVVTVSFVPPGTGTLITTATVSGAGQDISQGNNTHTIAATVVAAGTGVNLTLSKTGPAASVAIGTPFAYGLTVTNAGLTTATGVTVIDPIPAGLVISGATASQGACSIAAGQVVCALDTLSSGQTVTIALSANATVAGLVTNAASVTADGLELTPADNVAVVQTMVLATAACSVPTFTGPVSYQGSPGPTAVVKLVDMDHDGDLDAVATHEINGGGVDVFLNDGAGHFAAPRFTSTVTGPWVHVVADFNGDTYPDVISSSDGTDGNPPTLRFLTNDGTGALTLVPGFSVPFGGWLEAADFDRDGDQDVVFVTPEGDVALLRNDGAANFAAPLTIVSGSGGFFGLGDYNGDNRTDLIVPLGAAGYGVVLADTTGGFLAPVVHAVPGGVNFGSAGDLNGDGHLDLLLIAGDEQEPSGQTSVVLGDGAGGFGAAVEVAAGSFIYFPTLADMNGDGKIDLVAISGLNAFEVRLGDGAGSFSAALRFANANGYGPAVGDVNGDGRPDLVSPDRSGQINVFLNNCGAPAASLSVAVSESADPVNEGDELTYTVTVTNHADTAATGVRLRSVIGSPTDDEPDGPNVDVVSITPSAGGGTLATAGAVFTWTVPTVAANSTATFQFRFRALGGDLIFTTGVTSDGAESDPFDNAASATTTVTSTGRTITVTNVNDSGAGSLRQALIESNLDANDVDHIAFNIGTGGPQTITVLSALPDVETPAIIDGTTQPGFSGTPIIELNGNGLAGTNGLFISGGATTVRGLAINRFGQNGIALLNGGGNVIEGNYIGLDIAGAAARPNVFNGVLVFSANNRIGGPTEAQRNVISGNTELGVFIGNATATGNVVEGNYIGLNAAGTAALSNGGGIAINGASGNSVRGTVVSGNASHGIQVFGAASVGNILQGNLIGTDPTGASRIANAFVGVQVWSARDTVIGGSGGARNIISGNNTGIELRTGAGGTRVENNYIGVNAAGSGAIANAVGISITDAANGNTIGGTTAGAGNVISGNTNSGVSVTANARFNLIQGNRIGTNANGIGAVPNGTGVSVAAPNTTVGGTNPLAKNVLSGNTGYGVSLTSNSLDSVVQGNYIGTNIAGTAAVPNGLSGVNLNSALSVTIGGTAAGAGNVISGNVFNGIFVSGSLGDLIQGNFIGTNVDGTTAISNGSHGISIGNSDGMTVGGTAAGARNVISGNGADGVSITGSSESTTIQGNLIGTNASGNAALGNQHGVTSVGTTLIGGTTASARNVISGNRTEGIRLSGAGTEGSVVQGNFIGTDITGAAPVPNLSHGVWLSDAVSVSVGGTQAGAGNSIRNNGGAGIAVSGALARDNAIQGNSLTDNGGPGIDLGANGVTPNDAGDADDGPNHLQNFPVLSGAQEIDFVMTVAGTLNSAPNTTYRIEFFAIAACDALGNGEGRDFLGATNVTTNASGNVTFSANPTLATLITATATDPAGNTSEFSNCRFVNEGAADASISIGDSADPVVVGTPFNYVLTVQNAGPNTARLTEVVDTLPAGVVATAAQSTRGTCTIGIGQVTCELGNVPIGQNAVITITVVASTAGLITNRASVEVVQSDFNRGNNTDTEQTLVQATAACTTGGASGPTILQTGGNTFDVLTGDLNGDGKLDLVSPVPSLNSVAVFLGNGTGAFGAATLFPAGEGALEGVLVDLNNDGRLDLALEGAHDAFVLLGNGAGGFAAPVTYAFDDVAVGDVRAADFNGDGKQDLAIAVGFGAGDSIKVLLGDGTGNFGAPITVPLPAPAVRVVPIDVNDDGTTDLAVSYLLAPLNAPVADFVSILLGDGTGGFAPPVSVPLNQTSSQSVVFALGDLNSDGHQDLGVTEIKGTGRQFSLLFGNGTGGFTPQLLADAPPTVNIVTSGDVTGDGLLDLMGSTANLLQLWLGNGTGEFGAEGAFMAPFGGEVRLADFNGDGHLDAAVAVTNGGGVSILLSACGQTPTDLSLAITDTPDPATEGIPVTYAATIANESATVGAVNVTFTTVLPVTLSDPSVTPTQGSCSVAARIVSCNLGSLAPGASAGVTLIATPISGTPLSLSAGVSSDMGDEDVFNNTVTVQTAVAAAGRTIVVTNTNNAGPGSLRQAITESNGDAGDIDRIHFNVPGSGPFAIALQTALPNLSQPVTIDAATQPGYSGMPLVELVGNAASANGFSVAAGNTTIRGFAITSFPGNGIRITGPGGNVIEANHIGVDPGGTLGRGNGTGGIVIEGSSNNRVGGTLPAQQNVVSANGFAGVSVNGATSTGNLIQGNRIGTNRAGTADLGNGQHGVLILDGSSNTIGGNTAAAGNVISGNLYGVSVHIGAGNAILNNLIGVSASGMTALPNDTHAININENATGTQIVGNVLSGNQGSGVILNNGSSGSVVQGNRIGTAIDGVTLVPNQGQGVIIIDSASNTIGGPLTSAGNVIAGNGSHGVAVQGATSIGNAILSNSILSNAGLGIELNADGPTPNDVNDVDAGANGGQNFPVLSNAVLTSTQLEFQVDLNSVAGRPHTLEFFRNTSCDSSGFGEGAAPLAVSTFGPVVQNLSYSVTVPASLVAAGEFITATATSTDGTSEFSRCLQIPGVARKIGLALADATVVGVGRGVMLQITLPAAAPAEGVTVTIASGSPDLLTVAAPGTVAFAAGSTIGQISLTGVQAGTATVSASAPGYADGTLSVLVTENLISTPPSLTVAFGQSRSLPVNIGPSPAPPGGLTLDVVSSDPANVEVLTAIITVPEGAFSANGSIRGNRIGGASVTVSNPAFSPSTTNVASTAELNILQTSVTFNDGLPPPALTLRLESGGTPTAAQPALTAQLASANPACVTVPATATIAAGLVSTTFTPAFGGTAALPCTTTVTASSADVLSDSVSITVNPMAAISAPGPMIVGAGLMVATGASLGSFQHGGVNVTITSGDPTRVLISGNAETPGTASVTLRVPDGQSFVPYVLQGVENTTGTASITLAAPGFTGASHDTAVVAPGLEIHGLDPSTTLLSLDDTNWYVQVGLPNADGSSLAQVQYVRPGPPLIVTLTNSDDAVAMLRSDEPAATGQSVTKPIQPGWYYTRSVAPGTSWGLGFEALTNGTTSVAVAGPAGVRTMSTTGVREVQVVGGSITPPGTVTLGSGLMTSAFATLSASGHGGIDVTLTSDDPSRVLVSADTTTVGQSSVTITVPNGQSGVLYYLHAPQNATGSATVTISTRESQFGTSSHSVDVVAAGVEIYGLDATMSPVSGEDSDVYAQVGIPNADGSSLSQVQVVRTGFPLVLTFTNSQAAVGRLRSDQPAAIGQSVTKPIEPGGYFTLPVTTGTAWGLAFEPLANGTTTVTVSGPPGVRTMSATGVREVAVANASITAPGPVLVGSRLMTFTAAQLSAANHGGVEATVTSSDPARLLLSPDGITVGTPSLSISVPNGQAGIQYYVLGVADAAGTATVTISAPGFGEASHHVSVVPSAVEIHNLDPEMSNLSPDDLDWYVQVGIPNTDGTSLSQVQLVQPGPPLVVTLTNSQTTVGRLHSDEPVATAQSVTKPIQPGSYFTIATIPGSVFGLGFEPLSNGATTVTAVGPAGVQTMSLTGIRSVNVSTPRVIVPAAETVGAGLQTPIFATLNASQHGGVSVSITSSAPGILRVSPEATTTGEASFSYTVANGDTGVPFFIQGMENASGTAVVTLSAPGFETASMTVTVTQSAIEIQGLPLVTTAGADEEVNWYVLTGIPNAQGSALTVAQPVRAGAPPFVVTLTANNALARLHSDEPFAVGQTVTKPILPGSYYTQSAAPGTTFGLGFKGLAAGSVVVSVTGPPGVSVTDQGSRTVTINP